jgi:hypothetical protein
MYELENFKAGAAGTNFPRSKPDADLKQPEFKYIHFSLLFSRLLYYIFRA